MQIIASLQRSLQLLRMRLIPQNLIEINHLIENPTLPNKLINPLSRLLPFWIAVTLRRDIIPWCTKRRDRRRKDRDIRCLKSNNHLLEGSDQTIADYFLGSGVCGTGPDVVYALEDHGVLHAAVREHVSVDSSKGVGSQPIVEDAVSACCLVEYCDIGGIVVRLHAGENEIRPPIVLVVVATTAIGDAVSYNGEGAVVLGSVDFDCREKIPISERAISLLLHSRKDRGEEVTHQC